MQKLCVKARLATLELADVMRPEDENETNSDWPQQLSHKIIGGVDAFKRACTADTHQDAS